MEIENIVEKELANLTCLDFIGLAYSCGIGVHTEEGAIRHDFENLAKEIITFFSSLEKSKRNKLLRRIRQVSKYNRTHKIEI